jgi:hypothetical protein
MRPAFTSCISNRDITNYKASGLKAYSNYVWNYKEAQYKHYKLCHFLGHNKLTRLALLYISRLPNPDSYTPQILSLKP